MRSMGGLVLVIAGLVFAGSAVLFGATVVDAVRVAEVPASSEAAPEPSQGGEVEAGVDAGVDAGGCRGAARPHFIRSISLLVREHTWSWRIPLSPFGRLRVTQSALQAARALPAAVVVSRASD